MEFFAWKVLSTDECSLVSGRVKGCPAQDKNTKPLPEQSSGEQKTPQNSTQAKDSWQDFAEIVLVYRGKPVVDLQAK